MVGLLTLEVVSTIGTDSYFIQAHSSSNYNEGGGFCAYSDITLSYRYARQHFSHIKKIMIIDCDAHQGNGHAVRNSPFVCPNFFIERQTTLQGPIPFYCGLLQSSDLPRVTLPQGALIHNSRDRPAKKAIDVQILATDNIQVRKGC